MVTILEDSVSLGTGYGTIDVLYNYLFDIFSSSYLMKAVLITNTMNIDIAKRKTLNHRPTKPKQPIVSKISQHAYISSASLISFSVK